MGTLIGRFWPYMYMYVVTIELSFVFRVPIFFLVKDAGWSTNQTSDLLQTFDMFDHE